MDVNITTIEANTNHGYEREKFPPIKQDVNGYWILNPSAPFELTVMNKDRFVVQKIRNLLDDNEISSYLKHHKLISFFAEHNLKIKEIEEYKNKYKRIYLAKIEYLKNNSSEWHTLGEIDKEDLMIEFREKAIELIYEKAYYNDLYALFECEPEDFTIADELIQEYGYEIIKTYLGYANNIDVITYIRSDGYSRPEFEKMVDLGLAIRGNNIEKEEILKMLSLNVLNQIANTEKKFYRKNKAIEYIMTLSNVEQMIGKYISFRSLFKLQPLPPKYSSLNHADILKLWNYQEHEVRLLCYTYNHSYYAWRDLNNTTESKYLNVGYTTVPHPTNNCLCAKVMSLKKYTKNNPPRVPCHIGCACSLRTYWL